VGGEHAAGPTRRENHPLRVRNTYDGGPLLSTNTDAGLTITPVFWAPRGSSFPAHYQNIIGGFVANVAAASGSTDNVFSVGTEYYQTVDRVKSFVT
jgi:hypothetical protein